MASIGHIAVGLAAARGYERGDTPRWPAMLGWSALALLPDIDVAGLLRGVPYGAAWGHRGATHSLAIALAGGIATGLVARWFKRPFARTVMFACVVLASHGVLDTLTDGGLGAALLWPFNLTRFFAPWQPIPVAPIGADFFTPDGAIVAACEVFLFLPLWLFALRVRLRPAFIGVWVIALWLIGSSDPIRERIVGIVLREDTRFAAGYSEQAFRATAVGDAEDVVRRRLGEPLFESVFYMPTGFGVRSAMELSAARLPPGCFGAGLKAGVVHDARDPEICRTLGVVEGISKVDMLRILGTPTESCAEYSESPGRGHARMRMVCFLHAKVELVVRRWV